MAAIVTVQVGLVELAVQQNYRQSANDPQIAATIDVASLLEQGAPASAIIDESQAIDISKSLDTFVMVFDGSGKKLVSGAKIGTATPSVPQGVFDYAKKHGSDNFTWQPQKGVRIAASVLPYGSGQNTGYVLAGRNIKDVEKRETSLDLICLAAWFVSIVGSVFLAKVLVGDPSDAAVAEEEKVEGGEGGEGGVDNE